MGVLGVHSGWAFGDQNGWEPWDHSRWEPWNHRRMADLGTIAGGSPWTIPGDLWLLGAFRAPEPPRIRWLLGAVECPRFRASSLQAPVPLRLPAWDPLKPKTHLGSMAVGSLPAPNPSRIDRWELLERQTDVRRRWELRGRDLWLLGALLDKANLMGAQRPITPMVHSRWEPVRDKMLGAPRARISGCWEPGGTGPSGWELRGPLRP